MNFNRNHLRFAPLLLFFLFAMLIASGLLSPSGTSTRLSQPLVGNKLPEFTLPRLDKPSEYMMPTQWKGQAVLVNVFASWCEPCKLEHALLTELGNKTQIPIHGIGWKDTPANISAYLRNMGNPYRDVAMDEHGTSTTLLGISGVPETMLIGRDGTVLWKYAGPLSADIIQDDLYPVWNRYNATSAAAR